MINNKRLQLPHSLTPTTAKAMKKTQTKIESSLPGANGKIQNKSSRNPVTKASRAVLRQGGLCSSVEPASGGHRSTAMAKPRVLSGLYETTRKTHDRRLNDVITYHAADVCTPEFR